MADCCCPTRRHWLFLTCSLLVLLLLVETELASCQQAINGPIRLERNSSTSRSLSSGRVQLYISEWGNICNDRSFGIPEADVVCHQLEYTGAISYSNALTDGLSDDGLPAVLSEVSCSSRDFLVILECNGRTGSSISSSCTQDNDTTVTCYQTRIWSNPYNGQVRLTGGTTVNQGLVEVYCNGQWGTVCAGASLGTSGRFNGVAESACRQLGYKTLFRVLHLSNLSDASLRSSQPIWLGDIISNCRGPPCLTRCQACPMMARTDCPRQELVTVECQTVNRRINPEVATNTTCTLPATANGPIQLWRSGVASLSFTSGRVQLFFDREWGNICRGTTFSSTEADVVCHQLGYTGATDFSSQESDSYGTDSLPTLLNDVECSTSEYLVILQCSFSATISASCSSANDLSVSCYATRVWDNPFNGQVRLVRGDAVNRGVVEVYCSGRWGTLCSDQLDRGISGSVCQLLGYSSSFNENHLSITGDASQPSWSENEDACQDPGRTCLTSCPCLLVEEPVSCPSGARAATLECFGSFGGSTCIVEGRGSSVNVGLVLGIIAGVIGVIMLILLTITFNFWLAKRCDNCDIDGEYNLCSCIRKSRSGSITIQHPHENGPTSEAAPTVETDLNTDQHVESSAVNGSNATQGGDSEERRAPRRPRFQRPRNQRQPAGSSDDPPVVFMFAVGDDSRNHASNLSEPVPDNDAKFVPPSDPTVTSTAPPSYMNSNQYTTYGDGDEKKQRDDPPPYYHDS